MELMKILLLYDLYHELKLYNQVFMAITDLHGKLFILGLISISEFLYIIFIVYKRINI